VARILDGRGVRGAGQRNLNARWSWGLDAERIETAEFTVELSDGTYSFVESEVEPFLNSVGQRWPCREFELHPTCCCERAPSSTWWYAARLAPVINLPPGCEIAFTPYLS